MAKQSTLFLTYRYRLEGTIFLNTDTTNFKTIAQAGIDISGSNNDSNIVSITVNCNDTVANNLILQFSNGATAYPWLNFPVPAVSGTVIATNTELLTTIGNGVQADSNGNFYYKLPVGWSILAGLATALSAGKQCTVLAAFEDF
jgi:hypothetical protein